MNCTKLFSQHALKTPDKPALWFPNKGVTSFGELASLSGSVQHHLQSYKLVPGDGVLLFDTLTPHLYASIIGILGMGCHVILVEPWMSLKRLNAVIEEASPKLFLTSWMGRIWGYRSSAIRKIPHWSSIRKATATPSKLEVLETSPDSHGIITFTSGTTGHPKGVVRRQGYLVEQHRVLSKNLHLDDYKAPDLTLFANFALANLASGRTSLLLPNPWKKQLPFDTLPEDLLPETITTNPAFLDKLIEMDSPLPFKSIHVGGALIDCNLLEKAFKKWPKASFTHVYGSSEAEPVCTSDARKSVKISKEKGFFQVLHLGSAVPEALCELTPDQLWISGPHVCPLYIGNEQANKENKKTDPHGRLWHGMGDRITKEEDGLFYSGRTHQPVADFKLEQSIYHFMQSSSSIIHRDPINQDCILIGEGVKKRQKEIMANFPDIDRVLERKIYRDKRHHSRIDRARLQLGV